MADLSADLSTPDCRETWAVPEMSDLGLKWVKLATNGTNPGLFQIIISVHFAGFVLFGVNLTHFGPKSDTHGLFTHDLL